MLREYLNMDFGSVFRAESKKIVGGVHVPTKPEKTYCKWGGLEGGD